MVNGLPSNVGKLVEITGVAPADSQYAGWLLTTSLGEPFCVRPDLHLSMDGYTPDAHLRPIRPDQDAIDETLREPVEVAK